MNRREPLGLYVHIPFCAVKCFYCDFVAFSGKGGEVSRYLEALRTEASLYPSLAPDTLYIGGGTPTELSAFELDSLLRDIGKAYGPFSSFSEATIEANPESTTPEKLDVLALAGITRVSFGLQTAQDDLLKSIGRRHTFDDFVRTFRWARARGFSVNVDLMCGLPGQTLGQASVSLARVLALEPDHLSVYGLSVEDRTLFKKRSLAVDEEQVRAMLTDATERLAGAGYHHYEISNFARPGQESRHNINYWRNGRYLGLGCGAAGHLDGKRYKNEEVFGRYLSRVAAGERPVAESERLGGKERQGETMLLGLRLLEGFPLASAMRESFRTEISRLLDRGLLDLIPTAGVPTLKLTREGIFLANDVFREFVAPFEGAELQEST